MSKVTTLVSNGPGEYRSTDGRVEISLDPTFQTWCDNEHTHPVRLRVDKMHYAYSDRGIEEMKRRGKITSKWSKSEGRYVQYLTYQCEGGEEHFYSMWTVEVDGEWTDDVYETFAAARLAAEKVVGPMKVVRPRKPVEVEPVVARIPGEQGTDAAEKLDGYAREQDLQGETFAVEQVLPAPAPDLHAVFATDYAHKTYRVSDPLPWGDAQDVWANLNDLRLDGRVPQVKFYEVRSVTLGPDRPIVGPEVFSHDRYDRAPLDMMFRRKVVKSRGFKNVRDAARSAWRRFAPTFTVREGSWNATGRQGRGGWFYYPNGCTAAQGLGDLAGLCLRKNMVVQGGDGRWYVVD